MKNGRRENKVTVAAFGKCEIGRKSASFFEAEVEVAVFFTWERLVRVHVCAGPSRRPYIAC